LKIADFGLATSGEWIYQESYRSSRRKDLLRKYHKSIISDGAEESLASASKKAKGAVAQTPGTGFLDQQEKWKKMHADSVVGTYYYMAPEVLQGESYNATADWSSPSPNSPKRQVSRSPRAAGGRSELSSLNVSSDIPLSGPVLAAQPKK
jgi:serine/threonine protein kinase